MRYAQRALAIRAALVVVVLAVVGGPGPACGVAAARAEAKRGQVRAEREMLFAAGPQILFEQVVCDLGQVGVGTGNLCEFRFGNGAGYLRSNQGSRVTEGRVNSSGGFGASHGAAGTGDEMLKITGVKATCGCTVVQLDKRDYAPGESGVIKVTYTAGSTP